MIRKRIIAAAAILLAFLLQTTIFREIQLADVVPNLLLVVTITYAYLRGRTSGMIIGLVCGLMLDMMYGSVVGLYAFMTMTIGFAVGFCQKFYFTDQLLLPVLLIAAGDFVYSLYFYVTEFLMRGRLNFWFCFVHRFLPEMLYTTIVGILIYRLLAMADSLFARERKEI